VWGVGQTVTGPLSDRWGRKRPDRRRHVGAGARAIVNWRDRPVRLVVRRQRAPRCRYGHGLSEPDRRGLRRIPPELARPVSQYLSLLARPSAPSPPASLRIGSALPPRSLLSRGSHFFPEPWSQSACVSANRAVMRRSLASAAWQPTGRIPMPTASQSRGRWRIA
jgi:hypothetical protein